MVQQSPWLAVLGNVSVLCPAPSTLPRTLAHVGPAVLAVAVAVSARANRKDIAQSVAAMVQNVEDTGGIACALVVDLVSLTF